MTPKLTKAAAAVTAAMTIKTITVRNTGHQVVLDYNCVLPIVTTSQLNITTEYKLVNIKWTKVMYLVLGQLVSESTDTGQLVII